MKLLIAILFVLFSSPAVFAATATLSWIDNSDNEEGFKVERRLGTGAFSVIQQTGQNVTQVIDTTLAQGTVPNTYCYRVLAFNSAGSSAYSNEACTTIPAVVTIPKAPSNAVIK